MLPGADFAASTNHQRQRHRVPLMAAGQSGEIVLRTIASVLSEQTSMTRMGLYKALRKDGNPSLATVAKVAKALGFRVTLHKAA